VALRFIDGFDHYATADLSMKWTPTGSPTISAGNGRRGTSCLEIPIGTSSVAKTLDAQSVWILGMALRISAAPTSSQNFLDVLDVSTIQISVEINTDLTLRVLRGTTEIGRTTAVLVTGVYTYIECSIVINNTTGSIILRLNGVAVLTLGPLDTQQTANSTANLIRLRALGTSAFTRYDDLYICDGTGAAPHNTFLGDCRIDTLLPNSDSTPQQWAPSTGTTHYTLVDEATPNTTDYVSSSTPTHRELFGMQDLTAATGTIYGAQLNLAALKSDAGARSIKSLIKSGSSEASSAAVALSTSQLYLLQMQVTDPATTAAWTESGINAVTCGAEIA